MSNDQTKLAILLVKHLHHALSDGEKMQLDQWLQEDPENGEILRNLESMAGQESELDEYMEVERVVAERKQQIRNQLFPGAQATSAKKGLFRRIGPVISVAAILVLLFGISVFIWLIAGKKEIGGQGTVAVQPGLRNDVAPGTNKAILTLADGSTIVLDSAHKGLLASQGGVQITKLDSGQLAYRINGPASAGVLYNTITTPNGGTYQVTLPDGTNVWLNAGSSLKYPATFSDTARMVELKGEAYFEVAKNKHLPFHVRTRNESEIRVLGTHFCIMAYQDEQIIKTSLLEGSVQVSKGNQVATIHPGQQANISLKGEIMVGKVDVQREVAWVHGEFNFYEDNFTAVMRQVSRWYDVEVVYQGTMNENVNFRIKRDVPLSRLLSHMERTRRVKFALDGRRLTVIPVNSN